MNVNVENRRKTFAGSLVNRCNSNNKRKGAVIPIFTSPKYAKGIKNNDPNEKKGGLAFHALVRIKTFLYPNAAKPNTSIPKNDIIFIIPDDAPTEMTDSYLKNNTIWSSANKGVHKWFIKKLVKGVSKINNNYWLLCVGYSNIGKHNFDPKVKPDIQIGITGTCNFDETIRDCNIREAGEECSILTDGLKPIISYNMFDKLDNRHWLLDVHIDPKVGKFNMSNILNNKKPTTSRKVRKSKRKSSVKSHKKYSVKSQRKSIKLESTISPN